MGIKLRLKLVNVLLVVLTTTYSQGVYGFIENRVTVELQAPWPTHRLSPFMEAAEFLADIDDGLFWKYIERVVMETELAFSKEKAKESGYFDYQSFTREEAFNQAVQLAQDVLRDANQNSELVVNLLRLSLNFRSRAPALEQQRQLSKATLSALPLKKRPNMTDFTPNVWAIVQSKGKSAEYVSEPEHLLSFINSCAETSRKEDNNNVNQGEGSEAVEYHAPVYDFDHLNILNTEEDNDVTIILTGILGTKEFSNLYRTVATSSSAISGKLIIRFATSLSIVKDGNTVASNGDIEDGTLLSGFGVTLDIKNMEYLTVNEDDDKENKDEDKASNVDKDDEIQEEDIQIGDFVQGVDFATIINQYSVTADGDVKGKLFKLRKELVEEQNKMNEQNNELVQLKVWEMKNLGVQALSKIMKAEKPLETFEDIVHNFPIRAKSLSKIKVKKSLIKVVEKTSKTMGNYNDMIFLNGKSLSVEKESFNMFSLLETVREEALLAEMISSIGIEGEDVLGEFVNMQSKTEGNSGDGDEAMGESSNHLRVDVRKNGKGAILFLNNIEKDDMYKQWPTNVRTLLQPARQLIPVRKNIYTAIFVIDPSSPHGRQMLTTILYFLQVGAPVRLGVVFTDDNLLKKERELSKDEEEKVDTLDTEIDPQSTCGAACFLKLFLAAKKTAGKLAAYQLVANLASDQVEDFGEILTIDMAIDLYAEAITAATGSWSTTSFKEEALKALESKEKDQTLIKMANFVNSKGVAVPSWSLNGIIKQTEQLDREFTQAIFEEQKLLAMKVWKGKITDRTDVLKYLLKSANAVPRYDQVILQPTKDQMFLSLLPQDKIFSLVRPYELVQSVERDESKDETLAGNDIPPVTIWVAADLLHKKGINTAIEAVRYAHNRCKSCNIVILPLKRESVPIWSEIFVADHNPSLKEVEASLLRLKEDDKLKHSGKQDDGSIELFTCLNTILSEAKKKQKKFLSSMESMQGGNIEDSSSLFAVIVYNGRVIELGKSYNRDFTENEFDMLVSVEGGEKLENIVSFISDHGAFNQKGTRDADVLFCSSALYGTLMREKRNFVDANNYPKDLVLKVPSSSSSALSVTAILNPLSKSAQNVAPILRLLSDHIKASITIVFSPEPSISEFPLPNFYRFASNVELVKSDKPVNDVASYDPVVEFTGMPQSQLLTLKMSTPEPWIVYPVDTGGADTDNIRLKQDGEVNAQFTLKSLLITGHCYEANSGAPPAGLQLELLEPQGVISDQASQLETDDICEDEDIGCGASTTVTSDTLVMNNLGYFQLRSNPGVWTLQVATGNSRDIYMISESRSSLHNTNDNYSTTGYSETIVIRDFSGEVELLPMEKRKGMESMKLLDNLEEVVSKGNTKSNGEETDKDVETEESDSGIWSRLKNSILGKRDSGKKSDSGLSEREKESNQETIHVFSVASGALYERFLRIMMVSVVSKCSHKVKFWIIENFLSPDFKQTIPILAESYGFEYDLVNYKWPHWLRRQTEKQRIIWGYKILFLDVLFPLNVPKVIYVDADQVVRADLKELWDMDLDGMPYGFTPFCDSRKETLGFQFWRSGYWYDHLRGKPYHISALFVVDLVAFRRMAVGDKLRAVYDQLSRDPNSLANLDQDLPNYAQNGIPIFSLPQEWLWCESWCSDASKKSAKTIDLCNNPLHKEPKLDMAKRVISGDLFDKSWVELDNEIKQRLAEGVRTD